MRRWVLLGAVLGAGLALAGCDPNKVGVNKPASPVPEGPHLDLNIEAAADTHYEMLCDVRTYQTPEGGYANRYGVTKAGPFKDYIASPTAHCTIKITSGSPPVKVTLSKPGTVQTAILNTVGDAGKVTLHVW